MKPSAETQLRHAKGQDQKRQIIAAGEVGPMKIYLICPVRQATVNCLPIVEKLEAEGHIVHFPPRDVDQADPTGLTICREHLVAIKRADAVYIVWDVESKGSHFDLGMAFALNKPLTLVSSVHPDNDGKSYLKVIKSIEIG